MGIASFYHQQAAQARYDATAEPLEQRRAQFLQSASRWAELAREADALDFRTRAKAEQRLPHPHRER